MKSVTIDNQRLAYCVDGPNDSPPLVLVHCLGANTQMWDAQVAALGHKLRMVRYDLRGHGESEISRNAVSIEHFGRDLLGLLDHLKIARAFICGLSLGGLIAQWFVVHYPERVNRAVFANTAARLGTVESWEARIHAVRTGGMAGLRDAIIARFFSPAFRASQPEIAKKFGDILQATNPDGYAAACTALRDADLRADVASIRTPTLVIAGGKDEATPPARSEQLHAAIQGSKFVVLNEAAHLSNVEQPALFNKNLLEFLQ